MMTNPHLAAPLAEAHRRQLLDQAEQHRLAQAAKARRRPGQPPKPTSGCLSWRRLTTSGAPARATPSRSAPSTWRSISS
jgi:hypothetical protein